MQTYESITFEVEKNLSKPKAYLQTIGMKSILDDLYKKQKTEKNPQTGKEYSPSARERAVTASKDEFYHRTKNPQ